MTKEEAIKEMVSRDFAGIPLEWAQIVAEHKDEEIYAWPMWGTIFLVDSFYRDRLKTRRMVSSKEEIDLDEIEDDAERTRVEKAIQDPEEYLEEYVDEEMAGADCILDKDGDTTAAFMYEIDGQYLIGVNGAGWNFYDGVWDKIYDAAEFKWHEEE